MAIEPEHVHIMSNNWDSFFSRLKRPPLSMEITPATFRYKGRQPNPQSICDILPLSQNMRAISKYLLWI